MNKILVKKLRVVKVGNWKDSVDYTRVDNHPSGKTFYEMNSYDQYTPYNITVEQMMKSVVQYKESGYKVILMEQ